MSMQTTGANKLNETVGLLQTDMTKVGLLVDRLDVTITKLSDISNNFSQMLAVHEAKISAHESTTKHVLDLIESRRNYVEKRLLATETKIMNGEKELISRMDQQYDDIIHEIKTMRAELLQRNQEDGKSVSDKLTEFEKRMTLLERWQWKAAGAIGVFTLLFATAISFIVRALQ